MTKDELLLNAFYNGLGDDNTERDARCATIAASFRACLADIAADENPPDTGDDDLTVAEMNAWLDELDYYITQEQWLVLFMCMWRIWIGARAAKKVL